MEENLLIAVGFICATILMIAAMYIKTSSKNEAQRTIQKALDSNSELTPELMDLVQSQKQETSDFRRGIFLVVVSIACGCALFFSGGFAWMFASIPLVVGLTYLALPKILANK